MVLFTKRHVPLVLSGRKTATRRLHKRVLGVGREYRIQRDWYHWTDDKIRILRRCRQRLGDMTEEDAYKEGYDSLEEFKKVWIELHGRWDPDQEVWFYEFGVVDRSM